MNKFHLKKLKLKKDLAKTQEIKVDQVQNSLKSNNKNKKKTSTKDKVAKIITIIVATICVCFLAGVITIFVLLIGKPKLNPNDFISQESSVVYDRNGEVISELGQTIRKK